jgi:isoquinoline 1-oxidoreductase beta subunit
MAMLGSTPRLARCLQVAAAAAGWDGGGRGSTMGLAAVSVYGSHIGLIANATIAPDQRIQVHRLVAAVDCGRVVNPQLVRQQVEGGLIWALGQATVRGPEWVARMPRSRGLAVLDLPRIGDTPDIAVEIIRSNAAPGGVSALAVPPLAPAIANAIYAATGKRLRNLPFDPTSA